MISAVIGANYGDEGKGLVTDYLSTPETLVVRFNGGAQAGHTVVRPDGVSHEFHHFGAGTFRGARTLLSRFFVVNPMLFREEWYELERIGCAPSAWADARARVSTPFDALLNQAVERQRGSDRHGSCGVGINETVTRCEREIFALNYREVTFMKDETLRAYLLGMAAVYLPERAAELGVEIPSFDTQRYIARYIEDVRFMARRMPSCCDVDYIEHRQSDIVFEGAQGLGLDEVRGQFPHVTRSRTGLTNVGQLLTEAGISEQLQAYYVTRSYLTRHGAGPLDSETAGHPYGWTGPETNVSNEFQGSFRYGRLDVCAVRARVVADLVEHGCPTVPLPTYAVTCLDQTKRTPGDVGLGVLGKGLFPMALVSHGPTREDVLPINRLAVRR